MTTAFDPTTLPEEEQDAWDAAIRDLITDGTPLDTAYFDGGAFTEQDVRDYLADVRLRREALTELLLSQSLCPLHECDYAICFDDDDPECASIRQIHPSYDS